MQFNLYAALTLTNAVVSGILSIIAWRRRKAPGATIVTLLYLALTVWSLLYTLELSSTRIEVEIFWAQTEYLGIVSVPMLWLVFSLIYTERRAWLSGKRWLWLLVEPLLVFGAVWSNPLHYQWWEQTSQATINGIPQMDVVHGLLFWLHTAYSYLLMLAGSGLLFVHWRSSRGLYRRQAGILLIAALVPWLANFIYLAGLNPLEGLDLTPFAFTITSLMMSWALFRYRLLDVVPVARDRVLESMNEAVIVLDDKNRIVDLNPAARRLIVPQRGVIGQPAGDALQRWPDLVEQYRDVEEAQAVLVLDTDAGQRHFDLRISPILDIHGMRLGRLVVANDITERVESESALRQAMQTAEAASRAKSIFLATMSHELRTPLAVILGYSEILQKKAEKQQDASLAQRLDKIQGAGNQLLEMIERILEYAQLDAGTLPLDKQRFDIAPMVMETVMDLREAVEKNGNTLNVQIADTSTLYGDARRLRQALVSLLDNAIKFTQDGQITVSVQRRQTADGKWVDICVSDTGIGMSAEQQAEIFTPFTQADNSSTRAYGGIGLSLTFSRRLVELMGGVLIVKSAPGEGSTFTISLPDIPEASDSSLRPA